jgi:5,6-dimethylbenzimidazole synthase
MTFSEEERSAIYRVIKKRRDVRRFRGDPIADEILQRILQAAAHAPSVGYMQPWNFLVIKNRKTRAAIHDAFIVANNEARGMFTDGRAEEYSRLKLEGILESPLNICVTCDRSRFGPVILGRTCQPEMDLYSSVCAVQNLWLAARAEGVGVGWVSIIKPGDLQNILGLPENVVPVAYLCVGYTDSFADEPELKTLGWLPEIQFSELVFYDKWGQKTAGEPDK